MRTDLAPAVHVVCQSDDLVVARVRHGGIHDVTHGPITGWDCSCGEDFGCCHVLAVRELTGAR